MIDENFSKGRLLFDLLALTGVGLHALLLAVGWMLLIFRGSRNISRRLMKTLVSRDWVLILPSICIAIGIRLSDKQSIEPLLVTFYLAGLTAMAWVTNYFLKSRLPT